MSEWKRENAQHKLKQREQAGTEDEPRTPSKKKKQCDWLIVYFLC